MKRRDLPDSPAPDAVPDAVTGDALRHTLAAFPTGVVLLAARTPEGPAGILMNSFTSLSLDPPLVLAAVAHASTSWPRLRGAERLGLSVLADHHADLRARLSRPAAQRFEGVDLHHDDGALTLPDAAASLTLAPHAEHPGGDHTIAVFEVLSARRDAARGPLVFHGSRYLTLGAGPA